MLHTLSRDLDSSRVVRTAARGNVALVVAAAVLLAGSSCTAATAAPGVPGRAANVPRAATPHERLRWVPPREPKRELAAASCPGFDVGTAPSGYNDVMKDGRAVGFDKSNTHAPYDSHSSAFVFRSGSVSRVFSVKVTTQDLWSGGTSSCGAQANVTSGTAGPVKPLVVGVSYNCTGIGQTKVVVEVDYEGCTVPAADRRFFWTKTSGSALRVGTEAGWADVILFGTTNPLWSSPDVSHPMFNAYEASVSMSMQVEQHYAVQPFSSPPTVSASPLDIASPNIDGNVDIPRLTGAPVPFVVKFNCRNPGDTTITMNVEMFPFAPSQISFAIHCLSLAHLDITAVNDNNFPVARGGVVVNEWQHNSTIRDADVHQDTFLIENSDSIDYTFSVPIITTVAAYEGGNICGHMLSGGFVNPANGSFVTIPANSKTQLVVAYDCTGVNGLTQFIVSVAPEYALRFTFGWLKSCGTRPGFDLTWDSPVWGTQRLILDGATQSGWAVPAEGPANHSLSAETGFMVLVAQQKAPYPAFHLLSAVSVTATTSDGDEHALVPTLGGLLGQGDTPLVPSEPTDVPLELWPSEDQDTVTVRVHMTLAAFKPVTFGFNLPINFHQYVRVMYDGVPVVMGALTAPQWGPDVSSLISLQVPSTPQFQIAYADDFRSHQGSAQVQQPVIWVNDTSLCASTPQGSGVLGGTISMTQSLTLIMAMECLEKLGAVQVFVSIPVEDDGHGPYSPMQFKYVYSLTPSYPYAEAIRSLAELYNATVGARWHNNAGWPRLAAPLPPLPQLPYFMLSQCTGTWHGVTCDGKGRPARLDLSANGLHGTVPDSIQALAGLISLDLSSNQIGGTLPDGLGNLTELETLDVHENLLVGPLPSSLHAMRSLRTFLGHNNALSGDIPASSSSSSQGVRWPYSVAIVDLHDNAFTGWRVCDSEADSSRNMVALDISGNKITASLSESCVQNGLARTPLQLLSASDNVGLEAPLPAVLSALTKAVYVNLANTSVAGALEPPLPLSLRVLVLRSCWNVTGALPQDPGSLESLDVRGTSMRGTATSLPAYVTQGPAVATRDGSVVCRGVVSTNSHFTLGIDGWYTGDTACSCAAGYAGDSATLHCQRCERGHWSLAGAALCTACAEGTYQVAQSSRDGEFTCITCAAGSSAPAGADGPCHKCPAGQFNSGQGASSCLPCEAGQHSTELRTACTPCRDGAFSHPLSDTAGCFKCPDGVSCSAGVARIAGGRWWPGSLHLEAHSVLYKCLAASSCAPPMSGIYNTSGHVTTQCAPGSTGPLCALCLPDYARTSPGVCTRCPSATSSLLLVASSIVAAGLFVGAVVNRNTRRLQDALRVNDLAGHADTGAWYARRRSSESRSVFRVLISFLQVSAMTGEFRHRGPAFVARAMGFLSSVGGDSVASVLTAPMQCLFPAHFGAVLLSSALLPLVCATLITVVMTLRRRYNRARARRATARTNSRPVTVLLRDEILAGWTALLFLVYTRVTKVALSTFQLHWPAVENAMYLEADFTLRAADPAYPVLAVVATMMLLVYTLAAPAAVFVALRRAQRHNLATRGPLADVGLVGADDLDVARRGNASASGADSHAASSSTVTQLPSAFTPASSPAGASPQVVGFDGVELGNVDQTLAVHPFSMVVRGYRRDVWWWEATVMGRKVVFAALAVFISDATFQTALACLFLMGLLIVHLTFHPYSSATLNNVETLALASLFVTQLGSLVYASSSLVTFTPQHPDGGPYASAVTVLLCVVNASTLLFLLRSYASEAPWLRVRACCLFGQRRCCVAGAKRGGSGTLAREGGDYLARGLLESDERTDSVSDH